MGLLHVIAAVALVLVGRLAVETFIGLGARVDVQMITQSFFSCEDLAAYWTRNFFRFGKLQVNSPHMPNVRRCLECLAALFTFPS